MVEKKFILFLLWMCNWAIVRNNYSWVMMTIRWWLEEGQRRYKTSPEKSLFPEPYAAHRCHLQGDFHLSTLQRGFSHWRDDDFFSWDIEKLFLQLSSANKQKCPSRRYCSFCNHPPTRQIQIGSLQKKYKNNPTQIAFGKKEKTNTYWDEMQNNYCHDLIDIPVPKRWENQRPQVDLDSLQPSLWGRVLWNP